ncbi:MAG: HDOD domain-containing protein [Phycisphaerae bacterium]
MQGTLKPNGSGDAAAVINHAIASIGEIATLPEITVRIIQIVEDQKSTARELHGVIKNDPALSSKILKVVNSAFYGLPGQVSNVDRAIVLLGLSAVKNIAIAASMTRLFQGGANVEGFTGMDLWRHSTAVGSAARLIAKNQGAQAMEELYLAGLIADLGLLILRQALPKKLAEIIARHRAAPKPFSQIEEEIVGADHQAFGQALAGKWRFPKGLCTVIGYHHKPHLLQPEFKHMVEIVHVADILACKADIGFSRPAAHEELSEAKLQTVGLTAEKAAEIQAELPEQVRMAESLFHN